MLLLASYKGSALEAAVSRRVGEKMDVWSLGVCLFELAAGGCSCSPHMQQAPRRSICALPGAVVCSLGNMHSSSSAGGPSQHVPGTCMLAWTAWRNTSVMLKAFFHLLALPSRAFTAAGYKPFQGVSYEGIAAAVIQHAMADLPPHLSPAFRSFIAAALTYDPQQRPSALQLLDHLWVQVRWLERCSRVVCAAGCCKFPAQSLPLRPAGAAGAAACSRAWQPGYEVACADA